MTDQEFWELAGYFANPIRETRIELEGKTSHIESFMTKEKLTFPSISDSITYLDEDANKWGLETRLYFIYKTSAPNLVSSSMTICNRYGYERWNQRLNSKEIITRLLKNGFVIGEPQSVNSIRTNVPESYVNDFEQGFNM